MQSRLEITKRLEVSPSGALRPVVTVRASAPPSVAAVLRAHFGHEVLLQKPLIYGSYPVGMHRDDKGFPINVHILDFLKGGDTIVITVATLLEGYTFRARSLWDAIAFEEFVRHAFRRFEIICSHAVDYRLPGAARDLGAAAD